MSEETEERWRRLCNIHQVANHALSEAIGILNEVIDLNMETIRTQEDTIKELKRWFCGRCEQAFLIVEEPNFCPMCGNDKGDLDPQ